MFNIGDEVIVREWDDMAMEYGVCGAEGFWIKTKIVCFVSSMKKYCGQRAVVKEVIPTGSGDVYHLDIDPDRWNFPEESLRPVYDDSVDFAVSDINELVEGLL